MKFTNRPLLMLLIVLHFSNCNDNQNSKKENLNSKQSKTEYKKIDLEKSFSMLIPNEWDSTHTLMYPSYEYRYYYQIGPKNNNQEGLVVKRLRFRNPILDLSQVLDFCKSEITTDLNYSKIEVLIYDSVTLKDKRIGRVFCSAIFNTKKLYEARFCFINKDSSITIGQIFTQREDTMLAYNKVYTPLNSIYFK